MVADSVNKNQEIDIYQKSDEIPFTVHQNLTDGRYNIEQSRPSDICGQEIKIAANTLIMIDNLKTLKTRNQAI